MEASAAATDERGISNTVFLQSSARAVVALIISAAILVSAFIASNQPASSPGTIELSIPGNKFSVVYGSARKSVAALKLAELSEDGRAILAYPIQFRADDYTFLEFTITHRNAGQTIYLLWRTRENPGETAHARLFWNGDETTTIDLSKNEAWTGHITELALDIYGDLRGQPIEFHQFTLQPYSASALLSSLRSQWLAHRGWTQKSAHHLLGTQDDLALSPTAAAASWAGLALLLLAISFRIGKSPNYPKRFTAYAASLLIPWLALDLLWQTELSTQLNETKVLFSGKTQPERHLADWQGPLYKYVTHLKDNALPEPGTRIFLLHDSPHRTLTRLKAQYYLLPHNSYNYDRLPRHEAIREADYILALGEIKGLVFVPETNSLSWKDSGARQQSLAVRLIDSHPQGKLYQVTERDK